MSIGQPEVRRWCLPSSKQNHPVTSSQKELTEWKNGIWCDCAEDENGNKKKLDTCVVGMLVLTGLTVLLGMELDSLSHMSNHHDTRSSPEIDPRLPRCSYATVVEFVTELIGF